MNWMSLISIEEFYELAEDYPELASCYDLLLIESTEEELNADTCSD